jgi:hypothetical protein
VLLDRDLLGSTVQLMSPTDLDEIVPPRLAGHQLPQQPLRPSATAAPRKPISSAGPVRMPTAGILLFYLLTKDHLTVLLATQCPELC